MRYTALYAIAVGVLMIAQWSFFVDAGQVPELYTAPVQTALHLAAELLTALLLIASGAGLLRGASWAWSRPSVAA